MTDKRPTLDDLRAMGVRVPRGLSKQTRSFRLVSLVFQGAGSEEGHFFATVRTASHDAWLLKQAGASPRRKTPLR